MTEIFKLRVVLPKESPWKTFSAENVIDAVQSWHEANVPAYLPFLGYRHELPSGGHERIYFSTVEVEGQGRMFARTYWSGIYRAGGVKLVPRYEGGLRVGSLEWIAKKLEYLHDPKTLLDLWDGEESWDNASARHDAEQRSHASR